MNIARFLSLVVMSAGFGLATGGCYAFAYAVRLPATDQLTAEGYGPFSGTWDAPALCFLGATLSSVGVALAVLGLSLVVIAPRPDGRRWLRPALWAAVGTAAVGGLGGALAAQSLGLRPGAPEAERDIAGDVAIEYLNAVENGRPVAPFVTEEFARKREAAGEQVVYSGRLSWGTRSPGPDEVIATVTIRASRKTTTRTTDGAALKTAVQFPEPKVVKIAVRVLKRPDGKWRIDDVQYREP